MANEIWTHFTTGNNLYARIRKRTNSQVYDVDAGGDNFEAWADGSVATYDLPLVDEYGNFYVVDFPSGISAGVYDVGVFLRATGAPLVTDLEIGQGVMYWDGSAEINLSVMDTVLDTVAVDVAGLDGDVMVGTDSANTTVPDAAGVAPTATEIRDAMLDDATRFSGADIAAILADTDTMEADLKTHIDTHDTTVAGRFASQTTDIISDLTTEINDNETKIDAIKSETALIVADTGSAGVVVAAASKTGYKLASDGLDSVSTTEPSGVASNFREMLVQVWRRLFKKTTMSNTVLKAYKDSGAVATEQDLTDDGTTQTVGDAS